MSLRVIGFLVVQIFVLLVSRAALAQAPSCSAVAEQLRTSPALVTVKALEHSSTGFLFRDRSSVYVAAVTVDVDRPGTAIDVVDATGAHHIAQVVARDAASGLARLRVEPPIDAAPLVESHDAPDGPAAVLVTEGGSIQDVAGVGVAAGASCWPVICQARLCARPLEGSPILGADGGIVGIRSSRTNVGLAQLVALAEAPSSFPSGGRRLIYYGGVASPLIEFAPSGGGWIGVGGAFEARYRDMLAIRFSLGVFLLPRQDPPCGEPPCGSGLRLTMDPSVGFHLRLGGPMRLAMAITPSIALAMRVQTVSAPPEAPVFDARAPTFLAAPAPGLAFNISIFELSARWKMATDDLGKSTYQIGAGFVF